MKSNTWIITRQIEMTKHESMNWWIQKAGTFGKVMLRRRKKSVQIFALSNLSRITSYKKNWNISRLYQYLTQEHYLLSRPDESIIIKLIQVKCDYVTISGQIWGWKKLSKNQESIFQDRRPKKSRLMLFLKKYKNQIKISLELTRKQAKNALRLLLLKKKLGRIISRPTSNQLYQWTC